MLQKYLNWLIFGGIRVQLAINDARFARYISTKKFRNKIGTFLKQPTFQQKLPKLIGTFSILQNETFLDDFQLVLASKKLQNFKIEEFSK